MTAQHKRKPRYIVGIPSSGVLYEGESKLRAWATWLIHRKSGAQAYDRLASPLRIARSWRQSLNSSQIPWHEKTTCFHF